MLASELLGSKWLDEHEDIDITGIAYDSRNVLPGNIFVCIKGFETDGHKYAEMAVKNGASLIVAEDKIDVDVPVWYVENSRIEIAEMACKYYGNPSSKVKLIGITGTNGKTTTTALTGEIMKKFYKSVFVVGNIGDPYTAHALETTDESVTVAEVSSFQLETIMDFHPNVSAITNITPDHLNRHHTMEAYIRAKMNIAKNQTPEDICVLNYEDEETRKMADEFQASVLFFSSKHKLEQGIYLDGEDIVYKPEKEKEGTVICKTGELQILGVHNYENVMAAVAMAAAYGVDLDVIRKSVLAFKGVEHRIEYVAEKNGVVYYNDSKGTNPDAAIKGIQAMNRPTILIGGGYDKQSDFHEWIQSFDGKVRYLVLIGATKEQIQKEAAECGFHDCILKDTFEEALDTCVELARPGDAVLLSPACASWGMFPNYEVRGEEFKKYVNAL